MGVFGKFQGEGWDGLVRYDGLIYFKTQYPAACCAGAPPPFHLYAKSEEKCMEEGKALIKRRQLLSDRISKMNYEVEKIDQRLDYLARMAMSEQPDRSRIQERFVQVFS